MDAVLEALGSPTAVVGLGATALVLLATTWYLAKSKSNGGANGRRRGSVDGDQAERPELDLAKYPGGHLTIYYGSQTGTAEMFAKQLASESENRGFHPRIVDLQDVVDNDDESALDAAQAEHDGLDGEGATIRASLAHPHYRDGEGRSKALFLMATYDEGEPTDNAQQFVEMMKAKSGISNIYKVGTAEDGRRVGSVDSGMSSMGDDDAEPHMSGMRDAAFLKDVDYAVFGLGNKQYEHYNNMSRFMDAALERCGAQRAAAIGLGDDDDDLEGDFETWKDSVLWPALTEKYVKGKLQMASKEKEDGTALPPCPYVVEYLKTTDKVESTSVVQTSSKHYVQAVDCPISARRELRDPSDPGSTVHMEIDISGQMDAMEYVTADNLGILPRNDPSVVEAVATALHYDLDQRFHLRIDEAGESSSKHALPFPSPCTVRDFLERYCDLTGPPRRSDLKQIAPFATNDMERKALLRMASKEGKAEYKEKIVEAHVGLAVLITEMCTSIECPLGHFAMVCPRLHPRYYTISSSSTVHPTTIHITFVLLEEETASGRVFKGVCSNYLSGLKKGDRVSAFVKSSTFRLPKHVERPVIMFGPGTGIAPMRAVLQERSHGQKAGVAHGDNVLYFGCKKRDMDYIYRDELEAFAEEGTLTELHLAFSREQREKVYVQHLLKKRSRETWELIHDRKASIFVCGAVKMGADVDHTLQDIISEHGGMSREKAKAYLDKMAVGGRFVQELWS
ncbi:hypothetical protein ACHAXT_009085 [Thalassiosira profunda]